jgi:virginiamycin B lyase
MRGTGFVVTLAAAAALLSAAISGCNYGNNNYPIYQGPGGPPTLPPSAVAEFAVPDSNATPYDIVEGQDGNMWFSEEGAGRIGHVTPAGAINEIALPSGANSQPEDIAPGPNNSVWFVETHANKIGEIDTSSSALSEFALPTGGAGPSGLKVDPTNANRMWFGEYFAGQIASINSAGVITEYPITGVSGATPDDVAVTSDGTVWFLDVANNAIGHMTSPGTFASEVGIPTGNSIPESMTVGPDGNLWFTEGNADQIGRLNVSTLAMSEFVTPTASIAQTAPYGITVSSEDNLIWFAENAAGQVGVINTGGVINEFGIPGTNTTAFFVAPGPDTAGGQPNDLWFTDGSLQFLSTNQVGKINLAALGLSSVRKPLSVLRSHHRGHVQVLVHGPLQGHFLR